MKYSNNLPKKHLLDQPPKLNINNKSSVSSITDANSSSKFKKNVGSSNTSIINKLKNDSTPFYNNKSTNNKVTKLKLENEVVTNKSNNNLRININSSKINMQKNHSTNNNNIYSNQIKVPNRKNEITNKSQLRKEKELKDNYSNKDKNVNFNVSHQNFALNSDFVCELQKDLKTIEVEEGIYSKTFQKSSNNNRIISFENLDDKEILSISNIDLDKTNNLDDTEINVQMMYQSAQEKLTHPHHFFLEDSNLYLSEVNEKNEKNEKSKTMKKLNKHDTIICNQKNDSEIKFNQSNPEKNNKAVNLIDLSDKGKYSSNIINQTDNSDKNINLNNLIKNKNKRNLVNSESSNTNLNYDIKTKIVSNEENTTKSVKNSIINKLLPNHENSTELADFNKNDDLSNKNNKCLGQRIIEENSLTNIIEDTKELRGSSYFSNGGNFSIKDVNSIEVRSYIFNNNNNEEKSNKNLSEDKTKNILINDNIENLKENLDENDNIHAESILKEDISNIAADNSIYQQNEDFSKLLTYKKCVEILDNKPIINIDEKSNDQNIKIEIEAPSCASSSESVNNQLLVGNNEKIKITEIAKNAENSPNNNDLYNGKEYCLNEFPLKTDKQSLVKLLNYQEKEKIHDKDGKSKRTFDGLSENTAVNISITKQEDFLNKNTLEQKSIHIFMLYIIKILFSRLIMFLFIII